MEYVWTCVTATAAIAIPAICTAWAQARIGTAASAMAAEKPDLSATAVLMVAIPETVVILGFVVALVMLLKPGG